MEIHHHHHLGEGMHKFSTRQGGRLENLSESAESEMQLKTKSGRGYVSWTGIFPLWRAKSGLAASPAKWSAPPMR